MDNYQQNKGKISFFNNNTGPIEKVLPYNAGEHIFFVALTIIPEQAL